MSRYAVLGAGGVGGLLAVLLTDAGHDVVVVVRDSSVKPLAENGFCLTSPVYGTRTARPDVVTMLDRPVDAVLVTPKATSLVAALDHLPGDAVGESLVVPFLNGLDHVALLRERYPRVAGAVIRVESSRPAAGLIEHGSPFARIEVARGIETGASVESLVADLAGAGFEARAVDDERFMLWSKLSFLGPFALLTTAHRQPVGAIRTSHGEELRGVVTEVAAVSRADGGPGDPAPTLAAFEAFGPQTKSSMLRGAEAGNPLEINAIGGAIIRAARAHGIPVPLTEALVTRLTDDERDAGR